MGSDYSRGHQADYVLSPFNDDEQELIAEGIDKAHDAALCFIREGIVKAMNTYN